MVDETNISSKLLQIEHERCDEDCSVCDVLALTFRLARLCSALLLFRFVFTSTRSYEAAPLCSILSNRFPRHCWYVEAFKGGVEVILVSLFLTTMGEVFLL